MIPVIAALGSFDINKWIATIKRARDIGKSLWDGIKSNPELQDLRSDLRDLLQKPVKDITDDELKRIAAHWQTLNDQQVHDLPKEVDPPPPAEFPYGEVQIVHPRISDDADLLKSGDVIYKRIDKSVGWIVAKPDTPAPDTTDWRLDQIVP